MMRACSSCGDQLPRSSFGAKGDDPHGRRSCKACDNAASRKSKTSGECATVYMAWNELANDAYKVGCTTQPRVLRTRYGTHILYARLIVAELLPRARGGTLKAHAEAAEKQLQALLKGYRIRGEHYQRSDQVLKIFEKFALARAVNIRYV